MSENQSNDQHTIIMKALLLIGIGGFVGSILRYMLSMAMLPCTFRTGLPTGTLTVNIVGSLLIGILVSVLRQDAWYYIGVIGFCGGFTTFSTFSLEMINLLKAGNYGGTILYIVLSLLLSVIAVIGGLWIGTRLK